ncbi:MAG: hypothetical protein JSV86_10405 [Gemmatimonadota bacterium]|nr:MAG: hypothetical protein JSV86_10405 [Gemmatimonadota bacterium]
MRCQSCAAAREYNLVKSVVPQVNGETLDAAQDALIWTLPTGRRCPCCGQFAKRYRYRLSANCCHFLVWLYWKDHANPGAFHSVRMMPQKIMASRDYTRPVHYGLIEEEPNGNPKKHRSGNWRINGDGREFVEKKRAVPEYMYVYNEHILYFDGEPVTIDHFSGKHFDYAEAMATWRPH